MFSYRTRRRGGEGVSGISLKGLAENTDAQHVALYGEVMSELHRRGIVRSGNHPTADMAERSWPTSTTSSPSRPTASRTTLSQRTGPGSRSRRCGARSPRELACHRFEPWDFDILAAVIFAIDMLIEAVLVPTLVAAHRPQSEGAYDALSLALRSRSPRQRGLPPARPDARVGQQLLGDRQRWVSRASTNPCSRT